MRYLMTDATYSGRNDCDLYFAQLRDFDSNNIRLGDPFFAAFLPVFDVENEMLGLGVGARALPGVTMELAVVPTPPSTTRVKAES